MTALMVVVTSTAALSFTSATPDLWGLNHDYREFQLEPMEPRLVAADLADGHASLSLYGTRYHLTVAPAHWRQLEGIGWLQADGSVVFEPIAFPPQAYVGTVDGAEGSHVYVIVTEAGVWGGLQTPGTDLAFTPLRMHDPSAPAGISVVFPSHALILPDVPHVEVDTPFGEAMDADAESMSGGPELSSPGPDRTMTLFADSDMVRSSSWVSRVSAAYNTMNAKYDIMAGFNFNLANGVIYSCGDESCDASWGVNTANTGDILRNWGNKMRDYAPAAYDIAELITGHDLTSAQGAAWQPGRYGVTDAVGISDAYFAKVLAHEVGHSFNGDHGHYSSFPGRAQSWSHDHPYTYTVCDLSVPVIGCIQSHQETGHTSYTHYEIMNYVGSSSTDEWVYEFGGGSNGNYNWVRNCNSLAWSGGSRTSSSTSGFGFSCTN